MEEEECTVCKLCFSNFKGHLELAKVTCFSTAEHANVGKIRVFKGEYRLLERRPGQPDFFMNRGTPHEACERKMIRGQPSTPSMPNTSSFLLDPTHPGPGFYYPFWPPPQDYSHQMVTTVPRYNKPNTMGYGHQYSASTLSSSQPSISRIGIPFRGSYEERKLNPPPETDARLPLTITNYRKKMRALLYYEEEEHVSLLAKNCNGCYQVSNASREQWDGYHGKHFDAYFCLHGMTPSQILYASQASSEVYISSRPHDVKAQVLFTRSNYDNRNEVLCIGTNSRNAQTLQRNFNSGGKSMFEVRFEVKHSYFNSLHRSINQISKESLSRIIPSVEDFEEGLDLSRIPRSPFPVNRLDSFQFRALQTMVFSRSTAPVLVPGPFGSGKTRLLSVASEYFITTAKEERKRCRILLCCCQQDSADIFMRDYFLKMLEDKRNPWQVEVIRVVSHFHKRIAGQYVMPIENFKERADQHLSKKYLVIVTTFMTALQMSDVLPPGFFTHILIDEGAQAREPECIAPLCMADKSTRIIIVGDSKQVGPKLVVLGKTAQDNGLGDSLLERLHKSYMNIRQAKAYSVTLCNNYRCLPGLLDLASSLFYDSSLNACAKHIPHIKAHSLGFICSGLSKHCMSLCENEAEANIIIQEVTSLVCEHHVNASAICIMSPSQRQVTLIRKLLWQKMRDKNVRTLSSYQMQGQEFDVLFLSTVECVLSNGKSFDPLKSLCHPAVFNTAITRARSLVIAVGNPNTLMRCEEAMGSSSRCWREFISRCKTKGSYDEETVGKLHNQHKSHGTFDDKRVTINHQGMRMVHDDLSFTRHHSSKTIQGKFVYNGGATWRKNNAKDAVRNSVSIQEDKKQPSSQMKVTSTATKFRPKEKADEKDFKTSKSLEKTSSSQNITYKEDKATDICSGIQIDDGKKGKRNKTRKKSTEVVSNVSVGTSPSHSQQLCVNQKLNVGTASMKKDRSQPLLPSGNQQSRKVQNDSLRRNYETNFPTLETSKNTPKKYARDQDVFKEVIPFECKEFHHEHRAIDRELLKANLCKENYRSKFHQLLCREEEEHERILRNRCDGVYQFHVYHSRFKFEDLWKFRDVKDYHTRFGHITAKHLDGDKVSYATQASEGTVILRISGAKGISLELKLDIVGTWSSERIYLGMENSEESQLVQSFRDAQKRGKIFENAEVFFVLKYSYFDRLHNAVDQLSDEIISKLIPETQDDFSSLECCNGPVNTYMSDSVSEYVVLDQPYFKKRPQMYALNTILKADPSKAPVLIAGSFGTGKTRLLARTAYQILHNDRSAKVLVCAHHQKSVDSLLDNYFRRMFDAGWRCGKIVRIVPSSSYKIRNAKYSMFYKTIKNVQRIPKDGLRLVLATFSSFSHLLDYFGKKHFTHILLDEGAQAREPETIIPLGLATTNTKIIIAGDHKQVGPSILVLGEEARENGLKCSLLERLHTLYSRVELLKASEKHCATLLTNFRSHHALLSLPSYLFYSSALTTVAEATTQLHPDAKYPLHFVCSSLDEDVLEVQESTNRKEASFVIDEVRKYVSHWPENEWGKKNLKDICVMATTANQKHCIIKELKARPNKHIKDIKILTVFDIQGREFQAIFLSTAEPTYKDGMSKNPTKSPCGQYVFNTAITRAKSLVVCVGNPFLLMKVESKLGNIEKNVWRDYMRRCMVTGTFHVPSSAASNQSKNVTALLTSLQELIFSCSRSSSSAKLEGSKSNDSIIKSLQHLVSKRRNYEECKLRILEQQQSHQDWEVVRGSDDEMFTNHPSGTEDFSEDNSIFDEEVDCELLIKTPRHAIGVPVNAQEETIIINGFNSRRGAFHGDIVTVGVFGKNENERRFGKVIGIKEACHPSKYVCRADQQSIITFYPIDKLAPAIVNLPKISSKILQYKPDEFNESQKGYITVFEESSVDTNSEEILLQIKELIPLEVAPSLLFVVKLLSWSPKYRKPLGAVVEALPRTNNMFIMEKLLKVAHDIRHEEMPRSDYNNLPLPEIKKDQLMIYQHAITIDPPDAINLDDALSFVPVNEPDTYELAVLIIDVAKYIEKDSELDIIAKMHATTVYAGQLNRQTSSCAPFHMLPPNYTTSRLTLCGDEIRPVIVVSAKVKIESGKVIEVNVQDPYNALMKPAVNLSYRSSQSIINGQALDESDLNSKVQLFESTSTLTLKNTLDLLFKVAMKLRIDRLRDAAYSYQVSDPEDEKDWQSHLLVEELMIWANSCVAEYLLQECPDVAILRRQLPPLHEDLSEIYNSHKSLLDFSLCFKSLKPNDNPSEIHEGSLKITLEVLKHLKWAYENNDISKAVRTLSQEMNFPQLAMIETAMISVSRPAEYICTDGNYLVEDNALFHYSIRRHYTHFSSPIRRYFDIVVQRILNALITHTDIPYDSSELMSLCRIINLKTKTARKYSKDIDRVQMASLLEDEGIEKVQAYVTCSIDKKQKLHLCFPSGPYSLFMLREDTSFNLSQLNYSRKDDNGLSWQIVSVPFDGPDYLLKCPELTFAEGRNDEVTVNIFPFKNESSGERIKKSFTATIKDDVSIVQLETWEKAQTFIKEPNKENLKHFINELPAQSVANQSLSEDALSDFNESPLIQYSVRKKFGLGSIVNAWIGKSIIRPISSPGLHLIEVAPCVKICLQHTQSPAMCFSNTQLQLSSKPFYRSEEEYVDLWSKALLAEASHDGVKTKKIILLQDASLSWPKLVKPDTCLDKVYYKPLKSLLLEIPEEKMDMMDLINMKPGDLVCARYEVCDSKGRVCNAVYHFVIKKLIGEKNSTETKTLKVLMLAIGDHGCRVSEKMKKILQSNPKCEMQIMKISDSFSRLFYRLQCFRKKVQGHQDSDEDRVLKHEEWSDLAACVALGTKQKFLQVAPPLKSEYLDIFGIDKNAIKLWELENQENELNEIQKKAIESALEHRFQLIQGPPGTGKSVTGAHLAYIFARGNSKAANGKCVLYCGPSNKAVDVVHDQFIKLNKRLREKSELKILRLYGRTHERQDYPDPTMEALQLHFDEVADKRCHEKFRSYALHYKIREGSSDFRKLEEEIQNMTRQTKSIPSTKTRKEYKDMLKTAEEKELKKPYDIILCTCNETCSKRLLKGGRVAQCIVDECGMANEPETLAAISKCQHAVLIGDHKQLQPVVKYHAARESGLSRSLFERYAENEFENLITLDVQYRMHSFICEGPSDIFYGEKLIADSSVKKRGPLGNLDTFWQRRRCPIKFYDVVGKESDLRGEVEHKGNVDAHSKCNIHEVEKTISVIQQLLKERLSSQSIAVLTPYAAQKTKIKEELKSKGITGIGVSSIIESQGDEYDVVILSTVRSLPLSEIKVRRFIQPDQRWMRENLGFLTDSHQTNVGITRARYGLIIIGNCTLLEYDEVWKKLIEKYESNGCIEICR